MNQSLLNIGTLIGNPHFRYPLIAVIAIQIAQIWLPQYKDQLNATQKLIIFYVCAAAANTTSTQSDKTQANYPPQAISDEAKLANATADLNKPTPN
jgi:hypothetical protein